MVNNLTGYVLNALDERDHQKVEAALQEDLEAREQVELLRQIVAPLAADAEPPEPPPGLALNTIAFVAERTCVHLPEAPRTLRFDGAAAPRRWFRRPDVLVAAAILVLLGGLGAPALVKQWNNYQIQSCKNNLRMLGEALQHYADWRHGEFPQAVAGNGARGVAGIFVPTLIDAGFLDPRQVSVSCPAEGVQRPLDYTMADLEALNGARQDEFEAVAKQLAPGYAYSLGYAEGDRLVGPRRDLGDLAPLLADRPGSALFGNSPNHAEAGQNVLFTGGHVRWCTDRVVGGDDIYLNRQYRVLAGVQRSDAVLGPSNSSPAPRSK